MCTSQGVLMRYGIVSDVHGNLEALSVALRHLAEQNVDRYAFLGDAVGYGANPNEVISVLRNLGGVAIMGNHDAAVAGLMDTSGYYTAAQQALTWCQNQVSADNLQWLRSLPYTVREGDVAFCHGSPHLPEQFDYLFHTDQVEQLVTDGFPLAPVTCIGHSHLALAFSVGEDGVKAIKQPVIACATTHRYIITVGSVGQPRDRDPRTCCGVFDSQTRMFEYHRLDYDLHTTRKKILDAGLAPVFGERLLVGI
jgi:diadenosine tetraphosphatase ApaH/serine/threonine PP2A family protein phosphatase